MVQQYKSVRPPQEPQRADQPYKHACTSTTVSIRTFCPSCPNRPKERRNKQGLASPTKQARSHPSSRCHTRSSLSSPPRGGNLHGSAVDVPPTGGTACRLGSPGTWTWIGTGASRRHRPAPLPRHHLVALAWPGLAQLMSAQDGSFQHANDGSWLSRPRAGLAWLWRILQPLLRAQLCTRGPSLVPP